MLGADTPALRRQRKSYFWCKGALCGGRVCLWVLATRKTYTSTAKKMPSTI